MTDIILDYLENNTIKKLKYIIKPKNGNKLFIFYKKYLYNYNYFLCKILGKNNIYSN
jgi:hypothetical protein